jgi:glycosyltransferase involved in cell wall biosynthesis
MSGLSEPAVHDSHAPAPPEGAAGRTLVAITSNTLCFGGAERQRVVLANGLVDRGYEVRVVLIQDDGPLLEQLDPRVSVLRPRRFFNHSLSPAGGGVMVTGTTNTECSHSFLWRYAEPRRRRWIVASHTPGTFYERTYPRVLETLINRSDRLIALSDRHLLGLRRYDRLEPPAVVIPNGTDLPPADEVRVPTCGHLRFGVVARLVPQKGIDLLLAALAALPAEGILPWELVVAGWGDELDQDRRLAADLGIGDRVRWLGPVDFPDAIRHFDVLVLPSRSEALPMVLIEAMVSGVPVMASAVGSVSELLGDGARGVLVDPTVTAWRYALTRVLRGPFDWSPLATAALAFSRAELTAEVMVDNYARVIDELAVPR